MPYKFNPSRRNKIPKAKYRVTNWPEYDAALVRRGNLTLLVAGFSNPGNMSASLCSH